MSCYPCYTNCGDQQVVATTSTTTTTTCADAISYSSVYDTDCVTYTGCDVDCFGIKNCETLTQTIEKVVVSVNNCLFPPPPTTTTTTAFVPNCTINGIAEEVSSNTTTTTTVNITSTTTTTTTAGGPPSNCQCYTFVFDVAPVVSAIYIPCNSASPVSISQTGNHCVSSVISPGSAFVIPFAPAVNCNTDADCNIVFTTTTTAPPVFLNPACCQNTYNIPGPGNSFVVNGVNISVSTTNALRVGVGGSGVLSPSCLPDQTIPSIYIGASGSNMGYTTGDFTLTFSQPVNNVTIKVINISAFYDLAGLNPTTNCPAGIGPHLEGQEQYTFTVDSARVPNNVSVCDSCNMQLIGNKIRGLIDLPNGKDLTNGSGFVTISDSVPYTSLKIDGLLLGLNCRNESLGTFFQMCGFTIV